jgi:o-succinylbenzoate synthase
VRITRIELIRLHIPFKRPFRLSRAVIATSRPLVIRVHTDEGLIGLGEVPVRPEVDPETQDSAHALIRDRLGVALAGADPLDLGEARRRMDAAVAGRRMAKAGLEIALYDIAGLAAGVPVHRLLGGARRDRIAVGQSVGIEEPRVAARLAEEYAGAGFRSIKVKIGSDVAADVSRVREIRRAVGEDFPLRADANEGYSVEEATRALGALEAERLLYVEQPVARHRLRALARLAADHETPICADECIGRVSHAAAAFRHRVCDVVNIKPFRVGGLGPALEIAALAAAAGLGITVGSMVEHGIGTAAGAHLAAALPELPFPCDVKGPSMFVDDFVDPPIAIDTGFVRVPDGPGLGVALDDEKIRHYRIG